MNDSQRSTIMMGEKVYIFVDDHQAELDLTAAETVGYKQRLRDAIDTTNANDTQASLDTTGIAEAKNTERDELTKSALICASFLVKHARTIQNKTLENTINFNKSELNSMDDNKVRNAARYLHEQGTLFAAPLAIIKYTAAVHEAFDTNLSEFDNLIGRPKEKIGEKKAYTLEVASNIEALGMVLEDLDVEMNLIQYSNSLLYNQYSAARLKDDAPTHGSGNYSGTLDPSAQRKITEIIYAAAAEVMVKNTGTTTLQLSLRNAAGVSGGTPKDIAAGDTLTFTHAELGTEGAALWLKNLSDSTLATYKLTEL